MLDSTFISRRRLLTAMALTAAVKDGPGPRCRYIDPHRIVALEWLPVELMMALGDALRCGRYSQPHLWVNEPKLPDSVIVIGLRTEPNLSFSPQMKPSYLFWSAGYGPSEETMAKIAPGRAFPLATVKAADHGKIPSTRWRSSSTVRYEAKNISMNLMR